MKIVFSDIPKCAGSSVNQQLEIRKDVHLDYFNHPPWCYEPDRKAGAIEQDKLKVILTNHESWIVFGYFAAHIIDDFNTILK